MINLPVSDFLIIFSVVLYKRHNIIQRISEKDTDFMRKAFLAHMFLQMIKRLSGRHKAVSESRQKLLYILLTQMRIQKILVIYEDQLEIR